MDDRSTFVGRLGALTQITFAVAICFFSLFSRQPDFVPRWAVVLIVYAMPGVIAFIGIGARRPWLLVAAGLASAIGSILAVSGVTLIFVVPAVLMLAGAIRLAAAGSGRPPAPARRTLVAAIAQPVAAAGVVAMLVAGGGSALLLTEAGCWITRDTGAGQRIEVLPYSTGEMTLSGDAVSGGCTDGLISARGVGLGGVLELAALGLAALAARRPASGDGPGSPEAAVPSAG